MAARAGIVAACGRCNGSRGDRGVYQWLGLKEKDKLHRLVAGKYLKELYELHAARGTLGIDKQRIVDLCPNCKNGPTCEEWETKEQLTCFCLESLF